MKSPINSRVKENSAEKGSLIVEAMVAIAVLSTVTVSSVALAWSARALVPVLEQREIDIRKYRVLFEEVYARDVVVLGSGQEEGAAAAWAGDFSKKIFPFPFLTTVSDFGSGFGTPTCAAVFATGAALDVGHAIVTPSPILLDSGTLATDIDVRHGVAYLTGDSAIAGERDLYIVDMGNAQGREPGQGPRLLGAANTGPGLAAIVVGGRYGYVANTSVTAQLQVIDFIDRTAPAVVASLRMPLPFATSSSPHGHAIAFASSTIFLGTEKWNGPELFVIDVTNPLAPNIIGNFELGTTVKYIFARNGIAYVATAGEQELIELDVRNPSNIAQLNSFSPTGWQIEEGNRITMHHDLLWFARAGGGFNTSSYKEVFRNPFDTSFPSSTSSSIHIPGGVYGVAVLDPYVFLATGDQGGVVSVWSDTLDRLVTTVSLGSRPVALSCDGQDMYVATSDAHGFVKVHFNYE